MGQEFDPFQPPGTNVADPEVEDELVQAGKGRRFGTFVVDYLGFIVLGVLIGAVIGILFGKRGVTVIRSAPRFLVGFSVYIAYYMFFEGIWGRTPGKFVFGTVAVSESGGKLSMSQVLKRTLCRFIPFEPFSFLGDRGWHDTISKTYVVLARKP